MKISLPTRKDYKEIVSLVNEADRVFFGIYTKSEALEVGVSKLTTDELISGKKAKKYLVLQDSKKMLAFASFRLKNEQTVWISSLYVRVDLQGKGYGSKLLKEVENFAFKNMAKVVVLETEKKAKWAVNFYLKNGYKKITKNGLTKFPFDKVLEKPPVPNRYILGKVVGSEKFNASTSRMIKRALKDISQGKNLFPSFSSAKEAIKYLRSV